MTRQLSAVIVAVSVAIAACSGASATTPPITHPTLQETTTTSLPATTTTTTIPFRIADAPDDLTSLIESFYEYAAGAGVAPPPGSSQILASITPGEFTMPESGVASVAKFKGKPIATVEVGSDVFLAVDGGSGWRIVGGEWPSLSIPGFFGEGPRLVAVVGSDARPGEAVKRTRADSIHFVALDGNGHGVVVGVPRDSYVPVPGHGKQKINASLALGGPPTMMATFENLTGLTFEGFVLTGFAGFQDLIRDVLGGVEVKVPIAINDRWAHVALSAGRQVLNGAQALGFARARKTIQGGDLTRSKHQGIILLGAADTVRAMGYRAIPGLIEAAQKHLITDLTPEQLLTFAAMTISADPDAIDNVVAPGRPGTVGRSSVVHLANSVNDLWSDLADGRLDG